VTVARDGTGFRTDCVLHLTTGRTLEASGAASDAYASFDRTVDRLEQRLRRYKQRLKEHPGPAGHRDTRMAHAVIERPGGEARARGDHHPAVIAETTVPLLRLSVGDAVQELDLTGAPALVFIHAGTGRMNVVYRRRDGAIGWVDPPLKRAS
jgi:hypothetical protein